MSFSFTKTVTRTENWSHTSGFSFGKTIGEETTKTTEFNAGIEFYGVSVGASYSTSKTSSVSQTSETRTDDTYGGETSHEESWTATSEVSVPGGSAYECVASVR
jgi:hypothetical protein